MARVHPLFQQVQATCSIRRNGAMGANSILATSALYGIYPPGDAICG